MAELSRPLPLLAAFVLGACAATAVQSSASAPKAAPTDTEAAAPAAAAGVSPPITRAAEAERRVSPNGKARLTILARGHEAFLGRLEMDAGAAVPEHRDSTEEYIHVLEGSGTMVIDDATFAIAAGDTIYMPADAKVSFQNGDAPLVGLQVFAGPEPAAKYDAWAPL